MEAILAIIAAAFGIVLVLVKFWAGGESPRLRYAKKAVDHARNQNDLARAALQRRNLRVLEQIIERQSRDLAAIASVLRKGDKAGKPSD